MIVADHMSTRDYLVAAAECATRSPDPSTQNGACIPIVGGRLISACNHQPVDVYVPDVWAKPVKYDLTEHAERAAIFRAAMTGIPIGSTMYAIWAACPDCARAIVMAGIRRLVTLPRPNTHPEWSERVAMGDKILAAGGCEVVIYDGPLLGYTLRRNGEYITV